MVRVIPNQQLSCKQFIPITMVAYLISFQYFLLKMKNMTRSTSRGTVNYCRINVQARIFLSYSSQCETSVMRVSLETPRKKPIIMCIRSLMHIRSSSLDQEADTVWVMPLNFAHLFLMRIRVYNAYSHACAEPQETPIMHLITCHF